MLRYWVHLERVQATCSLNTQPSTLLLATHTASMSLLSDYKKYWVITSQTVSFTSQKGVTTLNLINLRLDKYECRTYRCSRRLVKKPV